MEPTWRDYAFIKIPGALIIVPINIIYKYIPINKLEEGINLGKAFKRGQEKSRRMKDVS